MRPKKRKKKKKKENCHDGVWIEIKMRWNMTEKETWNYEG